MLPALVELKRFILEQSIEGWNSVEHARTVTRTLEAILKVAEVRMGSGDACACDLQSTCSIGGSCRPTPSSGFESEEDDELDSDLEVDEPQDRYQNVPLITFNSTWSTDDPRGTGSLGGYEADTELKRSDTNSTRTSAEEVASLGQAHQAACPSAQSALHEGVCQIMMEILFELSRKCVADPVLWSTNLNAVLSHLTVVSRSLGGTEAILRGFALVLETSDVRLRELQRSILGLVQHILTPGSLTAFTSLFTAVRPPVDLLLPKFYEVTVAKMEIREPTCELEFPTRNGEHSRWDGFKRGIIWE